MFIISKTNYFKIFDKIGTLWASLVKLPTYFLNFVFTWPSNFLGNIDLVLNIKCYVFFSETSELPAPVFLSLRQIMIELPWFCTAARRKVHDLKVDSPCSLFVFPIDFFFKFCFIKFSS